ncbi:MAG: cell division protein ZapA [Muribaculaceae bacterium]|nr:cell division protein ZapA [Muribaculaceae bacterium]
MEEKVRMKLDIAGENILLSVPYSRQELTREAEAEVNRLFATWRERFPDKSDRELLAMIAFRYADRYTEMVRSREESQADLEELTRHVDSLVRGE